MVENDLLMKVRELEKDELAAMLKEMVVAEEEGKEGEDTNSAKSR